MSINRKWILKTHNFSIFLNVYMALIYVITWHNKKWLTKSKIFRFYLIYKKWLCRYSASPLFIQCIFIVYPTVHLQWKFGEALFFFLLLLLLFKVSNSSYSPKQHCSYSSYSFFCLPFVLFFSFYIYCFTDTTNFTIFLQLLRCQFLKSQNKIIKYESVTNHNWK